MTKVKICRVGDIRTAKAMRALGVDFIGLHLVREPSDEVCRQLQEVIRFCDTKPSPVPVLVTKNLALERLIHYGQELRPAWMQLHDSWTPDQVRQLRANIPAVVNLIVVLDLASGVNRWVREKAELLEFILVDHVKGGTGTAVSHQALEDILRTPLPRPFFIAGGLNATNVQAVIQTYAPFAVDVQSSLEVHGKPFHKDIRKTIEFLSRVRGVASQRVRLPPGPTLSLSVTDMLSEDINRLDPNIVDAVDLFHLDHADGSADSRFVRNSIEHGRMCHSIFPLTPFDLHVFSSPLTAATLDSILTSYKEANPFLRAVFCYVDPQRHLVRDTPISECRAVADQHGVDIALSFQARPLSDRVRHATEHLLHQGRPEYVSVVGPGSYAPLNEYHAAVRPFCDLVASYASSRNGITVDRDVSLERLRAVIGHGVLHAVAGRSIWQAPSAYDALRDFRTLLGAPPTRT